MPEPPDAAGFRLFLCASEHSKHKCLLSTESARSSPPSRSAAGATAASGILEPPCSRRFMPRFQCAFALLTKKPCRAWIQNFQFGLREKSSKVTQIGWHEGRPKPGNGIRAYFSPSQLAWRCYGSGIGKEMRMETP